jgi:competence protein ComEC
VIDVGQGDGILIVSPDGYTMLVDAGTGAQDVVIVANYMTSIGILSLDYTLVTHMDADHTGGMDGILAIYPEVVVTFDHGGSHSTQTYLDYVAATDGRQVTLTTGESIDLGSAMTVEVLHAHSASSDENANALVLKLTYGNNTMLVGGDCESTCEEAFDPGLT